MSAGEVPRSLLQLQDMLLREFHRHHSFLSTPDSITVDAAVFQDLVNPQSRHLSGLQHKRNIPQLLTTTLRKTLRPSKVPQPVRLEAIRLAMACSMPCEDLP